ncbi:BnaA09g01170D [Brassica napus]|uniref:BnaA09g01170D protein n=1 Tax=Brassica napus TaxID=3708 RepID=A0A078GBP6_BRANA|nr:BnaA09g01170D [Brassica napus]
MLVSVDTTYGSTFDIELNLNDKVLDIKNKIENSQGIPVSMQTLTHNGEPLLNDDLDLNTRNIVANSRLLLLLDFPYEEDDNQVLQPQPTEQSLAPVQDSLGQFQDWSAMARNIFREMLDQPEQSLGRSAMMARQDLVQSEPSNTFGEDPPLPTEGFSNVFHTVQSTIPSNTFGDLLFGEDPPLPTEEGFGNVLHTEQSTIPSNTFGEDLPLPTEGFSNVFHTEKSAIPSNTFGDLLFGEDPPLPTEGFSNVLHTEQSTLPSNTFGDTFFGEDPPLSTEDFANIKSFMSEGTTEDTLINTQQASHTEQPGRVLSSSQVVQTEKPPPMKEVINVTDSPVKKVRKFRKPPQRLRVMVLPHSPDNEPVSKVPVSVMANENVEEIRKELEKLRERNELKLPQEGYFFIHKQNVLDDDQTFLWNGVAHGDTIEVFPGYVTKDGRVNQRYRR